MHRTHTNTERKLQKKIIKNTTQHTIIKAPFKYNKT